MFIGHYGVAFALKKYDKALSLGWLFIAVQFVDFLWSIFIVVGLEKVVIDPGITEANPLDFVNYPFTHSLVAFILWSVVVYFGVKFLNIRSSLTKSRLGLLLGFAVFSHFLLDIIVHRPDLPLMGEHTYKMGFGLWNYPYLAYILEAIIFIGGAVIYYNVKKPLAKSKTIGLVVFTILLLLLNAVNFVSTPPDNTVMIGLTGLFSFIIFTVFGFWLDNSKVVR